MIERAARAVAFAVVLALWACGGAGEPALGAPPAAAAQADAPATGDRARLDRGEVVRIDAELSARRVAEGAYLIVHEPYHASNVLAVQMADGTVVICSSPFESQGTEAMLRWLRATFAPPRMIAINTHFHLDGTGGNAAYAAAGVETYASDLTQRLLAERGEKARDASAAALENPALRARVERLPVMQASRTFPARDGLVLSFAGEEVRVIYPGPGHAPDNLVVHFPARDLLFGGCMIKAGSSIGYTGDADLARWEDAVHAVEPLAPAVVIPGHGPPGGPELLHNTIGLVRAARGR